MYSPRGFIHAALHTLRPQPPQHTRGSHTKENTEDQDIHTLMVHRGKVCLWPPCVWTLPGTLRPSEPSPMQAGMAI
ncbi:hypothetical protein E2C01_020286 [Portunus trituberculatus]|uniref:Uncharacterized protein n=1 Tax=Portunus trituberculatus TaxID=210409 RepID=A0A5B7E2R6_PORTR|nr:hypothetical protein [Portunus trituberculatus]